MTINNLVTKLVHKHNHPGVVKKHYLKYCYECANEYMLGLRDKIAFKIDDSQIFFRKPPLRDMNKAYISSTICPDHMEKHKENYWKQKNGVEKKV